MSKALLDMDDAGKNNGGGRALDVDFINQQTSGFEEFVAAMNLFQWGDIEACNGPTREAITAATEVYRNSNTVIACYGMGLTQHRSGVLAIQMLSNLLLSAILANPAPGLCRYVAFERASQRTVGITAGIGATRSTS